jgi:hypothetical protein
MPLQSPQHQRSRHGRRGDPRLRRSCRTQTQRRSATPCMDHATRHRSGTRASHKRHACRPADHAPKARWRQQRHRRNLPRSSATPQPNGRQRGAMKSLIRTTSFGTSNPPWSPTRAGNRPEPWATRPDGATLEVLSCRDSAGSAFPRLPENRGVPGSSPGLAIRPSAC